MAAEILIKKVILDGGNVRFDLVGRNLPENFLGLAADLKFSGGEGDFKYQKMEWGNAFAGFAPENLPVKMIKNEWESGKNEGKIIFGISLKADNLNNLHDGVIGSFYFSGKTVSNLQFLGFEHEILSAYQNGRVDLTDVKWLDAGQIKMPVEIVSANSILPIDTAQVSVVAPKAVMAPKALGTNSTSSRDLTIDIVPNEVSNLDQAAETNLVDSRSIDVLTKDQSASLSDAQFSWWILPAVIGLFVLLLGGWLYWRKRAANRTWQYSPA